MQIKKYALQRAPVFRRFLRTRNEERWFVRKFLSNGAAMQPPGKGQGIGTKLSPATAFRLGVVQWEAGEHAAIDVRIFSDIGPTNRT